MAYEAMDAGIEPGGLRDPNDVKILICYLLKNAGRPLTFGNLNDILQQDGLVNYFLFGQSLHELLLSGHVDLLRNGDGEAYKITRLGEVTADTFEKRLPLTVREKGARAAVRLLERQRVEAENKATVTQGKNGYTVECRVLDGDDELLAMRLLTPEAAQAKAVREQFYKDPGFVYRGALALLTGDTRAFCPAERPRVTAGPPALSIRPATPGDVSTLSALILRCYDEVLSKGHSRAVIEKYKKESRPEDLLAQLSWKEVYLLEIGTAIAATGSLADFGTAGAPKWCVSNLFVLPEEQRQGYGGMLLSWLKRLARAKQAGALHVPSSRMSTGFYQKHGFAPDDAQPDAQNEIVWMTCPL